MDAWLARWRLDARQVRERMYRAPTPRERERWHALWLLAQGWSAAGRRGAGARRPHRRGLAGPLPGDGPAALAFEQTGGPPRPRRGAAGRAEGGGPGAPRDVGIALADWNWKVVRQFVRSGSGLPLCRAAACTTCTGWASY